MSTEVNGAHARADFVGSERRGACHRDEYATWKNTYHSKMVRPLKQGLLEDAADNRAKDDKGNHQFMDKQWNRVHEQREPSGQKNDWETQCATCHATGHKLTAYHAKNPAAQKESSFEARKHHEECQDYIQSAHCKQ